MASSPPRFLLPPHVIPTHVLPTHRLWPLTEGRGVRPWGPPPIEENGRLYQSFRKGIYPFPCDEAEKQRLDLFHKIFLMARDWLLHAKPLAELTDGERVRILDLGTGTGTWAIQLAELHPEADVLGLDLFNIQPPMIPRNVTFGDCFDHGSCWFLGEEKKPWDLIHLRSALGSVSSWTSLYQKIFQRLKPDGVFEQVEIDLQPRWEEVSQAPRNHLFQQWFDTLLGATRRAGRSIGWRQDIEQLLLSQGFVDFRTEVIKLPITARPSSHDPKTRNLSVWYTWGLIMSLEAFSLAPFTENLGWSAARVREFIEKLRAILQDTTDEHLYNNMYIVTARRPPA